MSEYRDLPAGGDEGHDDDEGDEGEDQGVLDHALSGLSFLGAGHQAVESLTVEPFAPVAAAIACSTTTRTIRLRQKWLRSALSSGLAGLAASSAAAVTVSGSRRLPTRKAAAAGASSGCDATAERAMRHAATVSPSIRTHTAAPAMGKSMDPRRRSFT